MFETNVNKLKMYREYQEKISNTNLMFTNDSKDRTKFFKLFYKFMTAYKPKKEWVTLWKKIDSERKVEEE